MTAQQVGYVELVNVEYRIYTLDPARELGDDSVNPPTEVIVSKDDGPLAVMRDGLSTWIALSGCINGRGFFRLGDGMFEMNTADKVTERKVQTISKVWGPDEWADLLATDPIFAEGADTQRLRYHELPTAATA